MSVIGAAKFYVWDEGWVPAAELCDRGRSCWLLAYDAGSGRVRPVPTAGVRCVAPDGNDVPLVTVTMDGHREYGVEVTCAATKLFLTEDGPMAAADLAFGVHLLPDAIDMEALSADCASLLEEDVGFIVVEVAASEEHLALYDVMGTGAFFLCTVAAAVYSAQEG